MESDLGVENGQILWREVSDIMYLKTSSVGTILQIFKEGYLAEGIIKLTKLYKSQTHSGQLCRVVFLNVVPSSNRNQEVFLFNQRLDFNSLSVFTQ